MNYTSTGNIILINVKEKFAEQVIKTLESIKLNAI